MSWNANDAIFRLRLALRSKEFARDFDQEEEDIGNLEALLTTNRDNKLREQVREFHEAFGVKIADRLDITMDDEELNELRLGLIVEECQELIEAVYQPDQDICDVADALGDLRYVIEGAALSWGIPLDLVTDEIHRSNMTKLGPDGIAVFREDGKILKGDGFEEPQLTRLLMEFSRDEDNGTKHIRPKTFTEEFGQQALYVHHGGDYRDRIDGDSDHRDHGDESDAADDDYLDSRGEPDIF